MQREKDDSAPHTQQSLQLQERDKNHSAPHTQQSLYLPSGNEQRRHTAMLGGPKRTWPCSSPRCSCFRFRDLLADSRLESILKHQTWHLLGRPTPLVALCLAQPAWKSTSPNKTAVRSPFVRVRWASTSWGDKTQMVQSLDQYQGTCPW